MAQMLIRNVPDDAKDALQRRALANGHSTEAEARSVLVDILLPQDDDQF